MQIIDREIRRLLDPTTRFFCGGSGDIPLRFERKGSQNDLHRLSTRTDFGVAATITRWVDSDFGGNNDSFRGLVSDSDLRLFGQFHVFVPWVSDMADMASVVPGAVPSTEPIVLTSEFQGAVQNWRKLLGDAGVVTDAGELAAHGQNTYGSPIRAIAVLRPRDESQVQEIVRISKQHRIPLYPISTGRNWGYGAASPVKEGCAIVDLSQLRGIRLVDSQLGIVALQPGVTQQQLADYLASNDLDLMVPVHGGGPSCSLLGNALERGYGLTPVTDHFSALTALRAVLPDGSIYRSPFQAMGAETIGSAHRWGVGPYVEGLFSQGNFGIVTEGVFVLAHRPEHAETFFVRVPDHQQLDGLVEAVRTTLRRCRESSLAST